MLAEVVEAERQIMLWERKIQLEKETQAALDPHAGSDVVGRCNACEPPIDPRLTAPGFSV